MATSGHQPSEELQAVGRRVGVLPQPMSDAGAFELRFELAGRPVVWSEDVKLHVVTWVTEDCAVFSPPTS